MFKSQMLLFSKLIFYLAFEITIKPMKMKSAILALAIIFSGQLLHAQLTSTPYCPPFNIDILDGTVSGLHPQSPHGDIKNRLPCFTDAVDELSSGGCGGVFFKDKGVYFYTYRDYIDIKANFIGTMSIPLMGMDRKSLFKWLGNPGITDINWETFQMRYGCLVLFFDTYGKVNRVIISSKGAEILRLCE